MYLKKVTWHIIVSLLLFLMLTPLVPGVYTWYELQPGNLPPERAAFGMLYDEQSGHPIIFDGYGSTGVLNDMWEYQTNTWVRVYPTAMSSSRYLHTFTYYPPENGGILIGGLSTSYLPVGDVWRYSSGTWTQLTGATIPARHSHAVAYDPDRKALYIYGGIGTSNNHLKDFWTYKNGNLTQVSFSNGPAELYGHSMAYLSPAGEIVLFGGADKNNIQRNDTWIYKNSAWTQVQTANSPSARIYATMVSDSLNNRVILFGGIVGNKRVNDLWFFDGNNWTQISTSLSPSDRSGHVMIYDPNTYGEDASNAARNRIFHCFGGIDANNKYLKEHWILYNRNVYFDKDVYSNVNDHAILRVVDFVANNSTSVAETVTVTVTSDTDPVGITLTLSETGNNTGVFTNGGAGNELKFSFVASDQSLRQIKVKNGDEVTLHYVPTGGSEITATALMNLTPAGVSLNINKPVYIGTHEKALITVDDINANSSADAIDTVNVTVTSDVDPVGIILPLTETDVNTGIFSDTQAPHLLSFSPIASNQALSRIKVSDGGHIYVNYTRANTTDSFKSSALWGRSPIHVAFSNKYYYGTATGAKLTVEDGDMNLDLESVDSFTVRLSSTTDPTGYDLTVYETGTNTGIFEPKQMVADGSEILFSVSSSKPYKNAILVSDGDVVMVADNQCVRTPVYATAFWGEALVAEERPSVYIILGPNEGEVIQDADVTFQFTAAAAVGVNLGNIPVRQLDYQTRLLGYEDTWGDWTQGTKRIYRNLPTGEYTFLVRCRNFEDLITPYVARRFYVYRTPKPPLRRVLSSTQIL